MKLIVWVATDRVGSERKKTITVDSEDWENMDEEERDTYVLDYICRQGMMEYGWREE